MSDEIPNHDARMDDPYQRDMDAREAGEIEDREYEPELEDDE